MAFNVRLFAYSGIIAVKQPLIVQASADSVFVLKDPYLSGQLLVSNGLTPVPSLPMPAGTQIVRVEVDPGQNIRYEIQMAGNARAPAAASPLLNGRDVVFASLGAIFSFIDAAGT
jgi:hypothetical protein